MDSQYFKKQVVIVQQNDEGVSYADRIVIDVDTTVSGHRILSIEPDRLRGLIHSGIARLLVPAPTTDPAKAALNRVVKKAVETLLWVEGEQILKMMLGTGAPKPPKDLKKQGLLLDWYTRQFADIGIAFLQTQELTMRGVAQNYGDIDEIIRISDVTTRSYTASNNKTVPSGEQTTQKE